MQCCAECFGDRGLRNRIIPRHTAERGTCSYCGTKNILVLAPAKLADDFDLLIGSYVPDPAGKLLIHWFREDWGLFGQAMSDSCSKDLLAAVLNDGEVVQQPFSPTPSPAADGLVEWEKLRDELMYRNRFFPGSNIDFARLRRLLSHLTIDANEVPDRWFRARIKSGGSIFKAEEMGAPPNRIASHGRANPAGIPYLYLGSTENTAMAEIRPHTGEMACIADFKTPSNLKLVDLRQPRKMVSPFLLEDAQDISRMRGDLPFLERLGEELTRPVLPQSAAIDYTPSQYLCEFIKQCGYGGVIYRSSVSDGMNLALFDPTRAECTAVTEYRVERVSVHIKRCA
jgi:hypothetical protein